MEYKTALEMSQRWSVTIRTVQKWANSGKLEGVCKIGRDWMIPEDTKNPLKGGAQVAACSDVTPALAMPLMNGSFLPGNALAYIRTLEGAECRSSALSEYYYFCGNAQKASATATPLLESSDSAIRLSALLVHSFANIELGEIGTVRRDFAQIQAAVKHQSDQKNTAIAAFIASMTAVLLHNPEEQPTPLEPFAKYLPEGMKLYSFYVMAHLWYLKGDYSRS
ncbi:MAG: helix-turn-helix domain-containing protein, partial [Pygmaiobacter sp.]